MQTSQSVFNITQALLGFHKDCPPITKNAENKYLETEYATLDHILSIVKPVLLKHGLVLVQSPLQSHKLETLLLHTTGEWIQGEYEMDTNKVDPQSQGSRISYQRRYAVLALLNLAAGDDDDGEAHRPTLDEILPQLKTHLESIETEKDLNDASTSFGKKYPEFYKDNKVQQAFKLRKAKIIEAKTKKGEKD